MDAGEDTADGCPRDRQFAATDFIQKLLNRNVADEKLIRRVGEKRLCERGELLRSIDRPNDDVRVEQVSQRSPGISG